MLAREQGQPEQARILLDEALRDLRELGNRREVARTLLELGMLMQRPD